MRVLIDADPIVYRCGFAAESATYDVVVEGSDGALQQLYFAAGARADGSPGSANALLGDWLEANPGWDVVSKTKEVIPEDVGHALHLVNLNILNIVTAVHRKFSVPKADIELECFLTGPGNFRDKLATIRPYKGNRDTSHKPYHYQAIRDHLHKNWQAEVVTGIEADDEVCIRATEQVMGFGDSSTFCVATIDKDLDQVPGWHYDYLKKVFYFVDPDHAQWWFWVQVLSGDTTDNIPGCYRIGATKAEAIVNEYLTKAGGYDGIWNLIVCTYRESINKHGKKTGYEDPEAAALETARLVRMLTVRDEPLWTPPTIS
jgi:hypothetical protein